VFAFLTGTAPEGVAVMTDITAYLDFVLTLFFAFGIAFEIPIATILLVSAGITTPESLASKRPYVIVGVFVAGMLLTPPDVISQTLLALPMWMLFELGIFFSRFLQRRRGESGEGDEQGEAGYALGAAAGGSGVAAAAGGGTPPGEGLDTRSGGDTVVGREISGGDPFDADRFRAMTPEEMEAELDTIEADEDIEPPDAEEPDPVDVKLERIRALREEDDEPVARVLLYEVLAEGDEEQRRVARNILEQLDSP
jgi:sec-independent protein translocase protein TatC